MNPSPPSFAVPAAASADPTALGRGGGLWLPTFSLFRREMVRFFRQRNRVVSALVTPIFLWVLLGSGLNRVLTLPAQDGISGPGYLQYFFPGALTMILLFTAIFSTISVIEDRREGFLQAVLVAPVPRLAIVMGKVLGGASIAMIQGLVFLLFWPLVGPWPGLLTLLLILLLMTVMAIGLTALGLCIAWPMNSTSGFHAIMMLVLMPMWFLSGALFPVVSAPQWMRVLMWADPLTYGHAAIARALLGPAAAFPLAPALTHSLLVLSAALLVGLATFLVSRRRADGSS